MELLKNTTDLIGLKDKNIKLLLVLQLQTHIEIRTKLDYQAPDCPHCKGKRMKYDFQKASTIPILDIQSTPTLLKLKKRHFQCKAYRKVLVAETSLIQKNWQISRSSWAKITQLHTKRMTNSAIAKKLHISLSAVQRKLTFIAQDLETEKIVTILENNTQATIT